MKKLTECIDLYEAEALALKLENSGIATHISGKNTTNLGVGELGLVLPVVHILFDHQFEDAIQLLENPEHAVETAFTPEDIAKIKDTAQNMSSANIYRFIAMIALACVAIVVFTYFVLA